MDPREKGVALRATNDGMCVMPSSGAGVVGAGGVDAGVRDASRVPLNLRSTGLNDGG